MKRELKNDLKKIKEALKPTLMFIPRGLKDYTDHGITHSNRVEKIISQIIKLCNKSKNKECKFNSTEEFLLYSTAYVHDIGCIIERDDHAKISGDIIEKYLSKYEIFEGIESFLVQIAKAHSGDPNETILKIPDKQFKVKDEKVKLRYISAVFRLADACDIDIERCPDLVLKILEPTMSSDSKKYWEGHRDVINLEFDHDNERILILVKDKKTTKLIIDDLKKNIDDVKNVLEKYKFPFLNVDVEVVNWIG